MHHRKPLTQETITNPEISLNHGNLEYVCKDCHDRFEGHGIGGGSRPLCRFTADGQPISMREVDDVDGIRTGKSPKNRNAHCYIIYGPPAAGKTTFVKHHKSKGDLVVDLDYLEQAISLEEKSTVPDNLLSVALALRECLYGLIEQERVDCRNIWVIAGLPRRAERIALSLRLGAELIFVGAEYDECMRRSEADAERKDKRKAREIIGKYFSAYEE
nr:HNH endonuclease [uncultured Acetatifactor sp.]